MKYNRVSQFLIITHIKTVCNTIMTTDNDDCNDLCICNDCTASRRRRSQNQDLQHVRVGEDHENRLVQACFVNFAERFYGQCGLVERTSASSSGKTVRCNASCSEAVTEMEMSFSGIAEYVFSNVKYPNLSHINGFAPLSPDVNTVCELKISLRAPFADGRMSFMAYLEVIVHGIIQVFSSAPSESRQVVNLNDINFNEFKHAICDPMMMKMDLYPILIPIDKENIAKQCKGSDTNCVSGLTVYMGLNDLYDDITNNNTNTGLQVNKIGLLIRLTNFAYVLTLKHSRVQNQCGGLFF